MNTMNTKNTKNTKNNSTNTTHNNGITIGVHPVLYWGKLLQCLRLRLVSPRASRAVEVLSLNDLPSRKQSHHHHNNNLNYKLHQYHSSMHPSWTIYNNSTTGRYNNFVTKFNNYMVNAWIFEQIIKRLSTN